MAKTCVKFCMHTRMQSRRHRPNFQFFVGGARLSQSIPDDRTRPTGANRLVRELENDTTHRRPTPLPDTLSPPHRVEQRRRSSLRSDAGPRSWSAVLDQSTVAAQEGLAARTVNAREQWRSTLRLTSRQHQLARQQPLRHAPTLRVPIPRASQARAQETIPTRPGGRQEGVGTTCGATCKSPQPCGPKAGRT